MLLTYGAFAEPSWPMPLAWSGVCIEDLSSGTIQDPAISLLSLMMCPKGASPQSHRPVPFPILIRTSFPDWPPSSTVADARETRTRAKIPSANSFVFIPPKRNVFLPLNIVMYHHWQSLPQATRAALSISILTGLLT